MSILPSNAGGDYQKEYHKLRTKRVCEILKSPNMSNDDFVFLDNFIKTYFPDASKTLKSVLTQDALKKVYQGTQYKELEVDEFVFTPKDYAKYFILVAAGKIDVTEENNSSDPNAILKSFVKGEVINPNEMLALAQPNKNLYGSCVEKAEILVYEKDHYDSVVKEFASAATNTKLKGIAKNFLKIKKMDRSSKEEFLTYFKQEKFTKGTVIVNIKSKIEEIYVVQSGKVVLCAQPDSSSSNSQNRIVIGVLGPESLFNESALLFEKASPYYALCVEDTELLSLGKANLGFVTDPDTLNDLRANCQCKQRLQSTLVEKYAKMSKEDTEKNQTKVCEKAGIKLKDIVDIFEKFDPKSKNSLQFVKNLEKFNKSVEKPNDNFRKLPTGPIQKFSEFATPRLVSKDPNFKTLDPQRQLALLALRNEGLGRRQGNPVPQKNVKDMNKDEIMKMQNRLLNEEKLDCERIVQKKTISAGININAAEEEQKDPVGEKKGLFNKMKMDSKQLLAGFRFGISDSNTETKPTPVATQAEPQPQTQTQPQPETVTQPQIQPQVQPQTQSIQEPKLIEPVAAPNSSSKLAELLGVNPKFRPQNEIITKKRNNLLKNPNLL